MHLISKYGTAILRTEDAIDLYKKPLNREIAKIFLNFFGNSERQVLR